MGIDVKFSEILQELIDSGGYSRNRAKILEATGITSSALSQYLHSDTRPTFKNLLALAEFFNVSLDYLVYGIARTETADATSLEPFARFIEEIIQDLQRRSGSRTQLVGRLGQALAEEIDRVAARVVEEDSLRPGGTVTDEEVLVIESYSLRTDILTLNLEYDLLIDEPGNEAAGRFMPIVAANLANNRPYRFLLPSDVREWRRAVVGFRNVLSRLLGVQEKVARSCEFRLTESPVLNGYGRYLLDVARFRAEQRFLYERVADYVDDEGRLAYNMPANSDFRGDVLIAPSNLPEVRASFGRMWRQAKRL